LQQEVVMSEPWRDEMEALRAEVSALRRRSRFGWTAVLLATVGVGLLGADRPATVVQADRFELVGRNGEVALSAAMGQDGPVLRLVHGEHSARLTAVGIELSGPADLRPDALPTVEQNGLGQAPADALMQTWIDVGDAYISSMEVHCGDEGGFRERAPFVEGRAVLRVPQNVPCQANFKGGIGYRRLALNGGDNLYCNAMNDQLVCRNVRQ
jgi:hypothetical protein